jgi:hypothetical protein
MSTFTGQSDRQPLQARQRSNASRTSFERQPLVISRPSSISANSRARPRVVCCSSPVTAKLGHITPTPSVRRHAATPMQRRTALAMLPPSAG